jgi:hypothetical protein
MARYKPRAFGGPVAYGPTTNTMEGAESLVGSDSLLIVADPSPGGVEANIGTDSAIFTCSAVLIESGTASDSQLISSTTSFIENNIGSDSIFYTSNTLFTENTVGADTLSYSNNASFIESGTAFDTGGSQSSGVESGMLTDMMSSSTNTILIENNTGSDSIFYTSNTLFTENTACSDNITISSSIVLVDASTALESGGTIQWSVDALTCSDVPAVSASGVEGDLCVDIGLWTDATDQIDANTANDTSSTGLTEQGGIITTNNMNGEDDLVISDIGGMTQSGTEALVGVDAFMLSTNTSFVEGNTGIDVSSNSSLYDGIEQLIITDSAIYTITSLLTEANTATDTLKTTATLSAIDTNSAIDAFLQTQIQSGMELTSGSDLGLIVNTQISIESLIGSDVGPGGTGWMVDAIPGRDVGPGMVSWSGEALTGFDSSMIVCAFIAYDPATVSESGGLTEGQISFILFVPFSATIPNTTFDVTIPNTTFDVILP